MNVGTRRRRNLFLIGQLRIGKTHFLRHRLGKNFFERGQRLARRIAARGRALQFNRAQQIEARGELRSGNILDA